MISLDASQRLVKYGFIKSDFKSSYKEEKDKEDKGTGVYKRIKEGDKFDGSHADEEQLELVNQTGPSTPIGPEASKSAIPFSNTGYPKPAQAYRVGLEAFNLSMEETYFWFLTHFRQDQQFPTVEKIIDSFSASENSSFWGQSAQRLGLQQDKAAQFLRGVSELIRTLFQIVRELRVIDERLEAYRQWNPKKNDPKYDEKASAGKEPKPSKSADVTLKSIYVELVEGGAEKINSVYGLARNVGYTILPDLFFNTTLYSTDELDEKITKMEFNPNVKNVLRKKLFAFLVWEEKTHKELISRKKYMIHYLRQHWATIKMYTNWIRPYLKSIGRLSMKEKFMTSPDIISAFETSMTEIEFIASKPAVDGYHPVVLANFLFTTKPMLQFQQDSYQARGAVHVGKVEILLRAYAWKPEQLTSYKKMKEEEDMEIMSYVDSSVTSAMEALGDDLNTYLSEAGEEFKEKEEEKKPDQKSKLGEGAAEPFVSIFKGFWEMFTLFVPMNFERKPKDERDPKFAAGNSAGAIWLAYKNYKKSHGMLSW